MSILAKHRDLKPRELLNKEVELRRWLSLVTPSVALDLLDLAQAKGETGAAELTAQAKNQLKLKVPLATKDLAVNGGLLMRELDISPGPELGKLLTTLLAQVIEDPSTNQQDTLVEAAKALRQKQ